MGCEPAAGRRRLRQGGAYQCVTGIIDEGFMGLLHGLLFLFGGEDLWLESVAHGVQDSIDMFLLYSGH